MNYIHVGKKCVFKSINEAIKQVNSETTLLLDDNEYREKVIVDRPNIIIDGNNKATIIYSDYAKKIHDDGREYITFRTYTVLVKAPHIILKNLTIINDAGEGNIVGQAVALHLYNDDITVVNCKLLAHQDTLFCGPFSPDLIERYSDLLPEDERIHHGEFHQKFINCYIAGTVDFIFGGASADFINCTIESLPSKKDAYVVAPDHDKENEHGFQFTNCNFIKDINTSENSVYIARPWREYGLVILNHCFLDSHIKQDGFSIWEGTDRHVHARFIEINSYGPGADIHNRVQWAKIIKK